MLDQIFAYQLEKKKSVTVKRQDFERKYKNSSILITGGAGSIGVALIRELCKLSLKELIVLDISELSIFNLKNELSNLSFDVIFKICDIKEKENVRDIIEQYSPNTIIHAAAYKHVVLMEENPEQAYKTNYLASVNLFEIAKQQKVSDFVFVSTDKAVEPRNIMGLSKKMFELYLKNDHSKSISKKILRFGNVINSSGSLIPLIKEQIKYDRQLEVRGKRTERYFIHPVTLANTILNILTLPYEMSLFLIEMGKPVKIIEIINAVKVELDSDKRVEEIELYLSEKREESLLESYESTSSLEKYNCYNVHYNSDLEDNVYGYCFKQFKSLELKGRAFRKDKLTSLINSIKYSNFAKNNNDLYE